MARIGLVLTPGFADWEYAFIAGTASPFYGIDGGFFAPVPGQLFSQGGLAVTVDKGLSQCLDWLPDAVVIVGGTVWEQSAAPDIGDFLRTCRARGSTVAGICGGTLALARAGLLNTTAHTSNSPDFLTLNAENYQGEALYQRRSSAMVADQIITAPGPAPVSFSCLVFEAAGLAPETVSQFRAMLRAEHDSLFPPA